MDDIHTEIDDIQSQKRTIYTRRNGRYTHTETVDIHTQKRSIYKHAETDDKYTCIVFFTTKQNKHTNECDRRNICNYNVTVQEQWKN